MKNFKIPWILLLFIVPFTSSAQHFLKTSGKKIVNENNEPILLRGMGLGGWMVQEGYMLQTASFANPQHKIREAIEDIIGKESTNEFYEAWLNNHVQKSDIDLLKSWGFNSVRLPMHYNLFTLPIEKEPTPGQDTWLQKGFELTDNLIEWCKANEMYVILDMHACPGGQGYDEGISDYDVTKPSLWESDENKRKLTSLWKRLAERYADEQWVAGYDLINEPNWDLPGGTDLKKIYEDITTEIRKVDTKHIIFIEGNWFANDFTGLTPPWDDNFVYSPHKYWSTNNQETMQWVLDLRNEYNVPLYLGESGENSNVWFRDAIELLEGLDIGWAWWPMKKVESIAGPLSVKKRSGYQSLLDFWSGTGTLPSIASAKIALLQLTEDLKTENCIRQEDVVDAMFRQVTSNETLPFADLKIPGIIHASDFDLGTQGEAYNDREVANYQVSTGNFSAWNSGWAYRNDGVDVEVTEDNINSNGFNVGFMDTDEWMQYEVDVEEDGVYDIRVRIASGGSGGKFFMSMNGASITPMISVSNTGGWQTWQTATIEDVILDQGRQKLRIHVAQSGLNMSSFQFVKTETNSNSIACQFISAKTLNEQSISMSANKRLMSNLPSAPGGFTLKADGITIPINDMYQDPDNPRNVIFDIGIAMNSTQDLRLSYNGNGVEAEDNTSLGNFNSEEVENNINARNSIPGKVEAEDYIFQSGIQLENTSDTGGGQNIGYLDVNDYADYDVNVESGGLYSIHYRTAAEWGEGGLRLEIMDEDGIITTIDNTSFQNTGNWQSWITTSSEGIQIPKGRYTMRIVITKAPFNLNWIEFEQTSTSVNDLEIFESFSVYPNPSKGIFQIETQLNSSANFVIQVVDVMGRMKFFQNRKKTSFLNETLSLSHLENGVYFISIQLENGEQITQRVSVFR